jgi:ABC-type nitrate/sulfonate/bicarbonate transport system substrate-binding protein
VRPPSPSPRSLATSVAEWMTVYNARARLAALVTPGALALAACLALSNCGNRTPSPATQATRIRVAYTSAVDIGDLPSLIAHRALERHGYVVDPTFFAQPELAVEALANGDVDIANGGARAFWAADARGANLVMLMEHSENGYLLTVPSDVATCAGLHDRTLALSSSGSLPTAIGKAFLQRCPNAVPRVLTMPHSGDRLSALLARTIDAAVLQRADIARLEREAPGRFHALDPPHTIDQLDLEGVFVSGQLIRDRRQLVVDYVRERIFANRRVLQNSNLLLEEARHWPDMGTLDEAVIAGEVRAPAWTVDGGVSRESIDATVAFFVHAGSLPPSLERDRVADLSLLADALRAVAENVGPSSTADERR